MDKKELKIELLKRDMKFEDFAKKFGTSQAYLYREIKKGNKKIFERIKKALDEM